MKKVITLVLFASFLLIGTMGIVGCAKEISSENLAESVVPRVIDVAGDPLTEDASVNDFALRLMRATDTEGKNTLISPLSVLCALSMTANGADGETLEQMEEVLGMTAEQLNEFAYMYRQGVASGEKCKLSLANSIWFTDDERFKVNADFLQIAVDYYGADVFKTPFNSSTLRDINSWVEDNTDGMVKDILDRIPDAAVMYLINALAFEAEWEQIYYKHQVREGTFTSESGDAEKAEFLYGTEGKYIEDEKATGFIKYYSTRKYAFAALLPKEGVSVSEYLATFDGEHLSSLLSGAQNSVVYTSIPKFEVEYDADMSDELKSMGMPEAFDEINADFSRLGSSDAGNIFISRVIHKTYISVTEKGTKAGAATVVEMLDNAAAAPREPKYVYLDRPFVYMLSDCEKNIPMFIGALRDIK